MLLSRLILWFIVLGIPAAAGAQELQARVTVNAAQVGSQVDRKIFQTLQAALTSFLNERRWTNDVYEPNERIQCNFLLNISRADNNVFWATLTVQAARPVYHSSYLTPLINFQDDALVFRYVEHQPLEFNENRISGSDGLASNLTATFAFYVYVILGLDYNSFSMKGGEPWFRKAQQIIHNAPDGRDITGWRAFDGQRNRYWLMENLTNTRYNMVHDAMYAYFRQGMDRMYEDEPNARAAILNALMQFNTVNNEAQNSMIIPFFFQGRSGEIIRIFKKAPPEEKQRVREMMARLDISNANQYNQELR